MKHVSLATIGLFLVGLVLACNPAHAEDQPHNSVDISPSRERGVDAWYRGDTRDAIAHFSALVEEDPEDQDARFNLTLLLREAGNLEQAATAAAALSAAYRADRLMTTVVSGRDPESVDVVGESSRTETAHLYFWRAVAELLHGGPRRADAFLYAATRDQEFFPYAHLFRGVLARQREDWDGAVRHLTEALRQDANLTMAFRPLAEARFSRGERGEAYRLLGRAAIAVPWDPEIRSQRSNWEALYPELVASREADVERRRIIAEPPRVTVTPIERDSIPRVRVGLAEGLTSVYLKTGGDFRVVAVPRDLTLYSGTDRLEIIEQSLAAEPLGLGRRGMVLHAWYDAEDGAVVLEDEGGELLVRHAGATRIVYEDPADTTIVFDLAYGHGQFSAGREDRSYRGDMELIPGAALGPVEQFTLVNDVNVEEYLYSVVPSEMPASWPVSALEAQAVAARSYTLHRRTRFHPRGFDLQSSVASAYYRGVTGENPRTTAAVETTRGLVLEDGRGTLDAVYSANAAGYTEDSESVWGFATSLVGVADPQLPSLEELRAPAEVYRWIQNRPESYSGHAQFASRSAYRWQLLVPREDIERRVAAAGGEIGRVQRVIPGPRGRTGRVESVLIIGSDGEHRVNRDAIRSRLGGLRSNLFMVTPQMNRDGEVQHFFFEGAGWGHGVGMCQTGAAGMGAEGYSSAEILSHYYPLNSLVDWY